MKIEDQGRPTVAIDVESTDHKDHWEEYSADLRGKCPVAWSTEHGGHWIVSSYKEVVRIAQDDANFTTHKTFDPETQRVEGGTALPPMPIVRLIPAETARPEWDIFRGVLNPHMGPRATEAYRADAEQYAHLLLDQVIESGQMDLVQDFTSPLAALVTMQAIGFPREQWREFADPCHALTSLNKASPEFQAAVAGAQWVESRIDEEIEIRKTAPRDDLISQLVTARVNGEPLKDEDTHSTIVNLLFGGVDTTTALTSHTLVHLFRHPDKRQRLIEDRSLLRSRARSSSASTRRPMAARAPRPRAPASPARTSPRATGSICSTPRPIATRRCSRMATRSTSPASRTSILDSARASTAASAPSSPG